MFIKNSNWLLVIKKYGMTDMSGIIIYYIINYVYYVIHNIFLYTFCRI